MEKIKTIKIAKRYIKLVEEKFKIERVLLCGSFAKGTAHSDSDIDLAIVFKSVDDIIDRQIELMRMRTDNDLVIEPHPFILSDFNESNPVVHEILENGIELSEFV